MQTPSYIVRYTDGVRKKQTDEKTRANVTSSNQIDKTLYRGYIFWPLLPLTKNNKENKTGKRFEGVIRGKRKSGQKKEEKTERKGRGKEIGVKKRETVLILFPCLIQALMSAKKVYKKQGRISKNFKGGGKKIFNNIFPSTVPAYTVPQYTVPQHCTCILNSQHSETAFCPHCHTIYT